MIMRMARATRTALTARHEAILEYAHAYYEKNKVGPLYYNFKRHIGATREEIDSLFPHGLNSIYTWVGIPIQTADRSCMPVAHVRVDAMREVYLDHNATTPLRAEVSAALLDYYSGSLGCANPSSSTRQGKAAYDLVLAARRSLANCLSAHPEEIIFTGCGSESNNLAIKGIAFKYLNRPGHMVTSRIEHASVLKTMEFLEVLGFAVTYLEVSRDGRVSPDSVREALRPDTILVSVMAVNNEIGTINPIDEIGTLCRENNIPFMVDAVQGFGKIPLNPKEHGISLLSLSGHKIYAPKGVGALFVDRSIGLIPLIHGGGQEMGVRSGTENVGHILALGRAAELARAEMEREAGRLVTLRDFFLSKLREIEPDCVINGSLENRIPHNLSLGFPGVDSLALLLSLDAIGISVSAGSACSAGKVESSHVLKAIHADETNYGAIRFSFGLKTTREDIEYLFRYLPAILDQIKEKSVASAKPKADGKALN